MWDGGSDGGGALGSRSRLRALVVEDVPTAATLIRRSLEADGIAVQTVDSLRDVRDRLRFREHDVVVLDVELPDGSGLDLLRDRVAAAPVVILSSHRDEDDRVPVSSLGPTIT